MAAAYPDTAAMQEQVRNLKMKEKELKKTIQEMTDENKIKVALQVKQIDDRNRLERRVEELQKKLRNMAEGSRHKLELLKREHNVELEDLKSLLYSGGGMSVTGPETEEARSKRSSVYLQILPPDEGAERISVSSSTKDLQNKLSQMELERAELCGKFARAETELQAQLKALAEENATIKAELAAKSSTSMQESSHTELQRCLDKMKDENKQIKGELKAKCNKFAGVPAESPIDMDLQAHLKETKEENKRIQAELAAKCSTLDYMTTQYQEKFRKEHDSYIDEMKKRTLSKLEEKEVDTAMEDIQSALTNQLSAANLKITDLELSIEQLKLSESDMSSELQNSKLTYNTQITAADEEVKRLQGRVDELAQSEGNLKEECDRLKKDYDLRMHTQDATVINMKNAVDNIKSQEDDLRSQMEATQRDYEKKLEETTLDYNHDMRKLAESIAMHQAELGNVVRELETARKESLELTDHFSAQLDSKSAELDALYERSQQIAIQAEQTQKEQDEKLSTLRKDMQGKTIEIRQLKIELQEKSSALETANQRLAEAEQNLSVWKSAASEKQCSESELLRKVTEIETQAKLQREALQDKINFMSKQATEADSSDVYERMALLEATLAEREAAAVKQETHIAELSQQLKVQRDQYEATFADMDEVLARQMKKTSALDQQLREAREQAEVDRQTAVKDVEEQLEKKTQQVDEASSKMGDVRAESSDRVKELKSRIEDLTKRVADKDKQLMEKDAEMQVRLQAMLDDFEGERQMLILDTQATAKVLNERLDKERGSMNTFKENVKKQFDDRQDHVKEMMNTMKARFAETLKDKEEIFNRRVQKAEKAKEREKLQALKEREDKFQQQFVDYKERNEVNFKVAVQELKDKYEREIAALKGHGAGGKEAKVIGDVVKGDN